jgi:hypothetical protein
LVGTTTTVCTITGGNGEFVFDTDSFANRSDGFYGVSMRTAAGADIAVSSVTWIGANELLVAHASTVAGSFVQFGLRGTGNHYPSSDFPRVNIRDTSAWPCGATGQNTSGWMMPHETAIV